MRIVSKYKLMVKVGDNDLYEITQPVVTLNNLIIGTTYFDICDTMTVQSVQRPELRCEVKFEQRGFWGEPCKVSGRTYIGKKEVHKISGNWNSALSLTDSNGNSEVVWQRTPFPEKVEWMYGMSKFAL